MTRLWHIRLDGSVHQFYDDRMPAVPSRMLQLGSAMPAFELPDTVTGEKVSSQDAAGAPATVVAFICNHCPYVIHIRSELARVLRELAARGVKVYAISSNDATSYPQDGPEQMKQEAARVGYEFPYLYDESQDVAKAFHAACTPDLFVYDGEGKLAYRGQFDDSRPGNGKPVTGADLEAAVTALLEGNRPSENQKPSIGCSLKWKGDNAPEWA